MPSPVRRLRRAALGACLGVLATLAVVGCADAAPLPQPTTSATGFASDDEAFAAAEATYRAYVDALNAVDLSDPSTFEPVYALTTGELNERDRELLTRYGREGIEVTGFSRLIAVEPRSSTATLAILDSCLDVSGIDVLDKSGSSLVESDRAAIQYFTVTVEWRREMAVPLITGIVGQPDSTAC